MRYDYMGDDGAGCNWSAGFFGTYSDGDPDRAARLTPMPIGFGRKLDEMHHWLKKRVGLRGYAAHGSSEPGVPEASLWYFQDVETMSSSRASVAMC
jgi:hypothetical protein